MHIPRKLLTGAIVAGLLGLGSAAQAANLTAIDATYGSFDGSSGTRTLNIATTGTHIWDVDIAITFAKCDDPSIGPGGTACVSQNFSYNREIVFRLTSPGGTVVNLVNQDTYSGEQPGAGRQTVTFDDEAAAVVGGPAVVTGTFKPVGSLAAFDGEDPFGNWTLFIQDTAGADPLDYFSSRLDVTPTPEPGSLVLAVLALAALGFSRRWIAS